MFTIISRYRQGQSLIEYIIIVGVVMTAVYVMAPTLKRGTQRLIKATADQIGSQADSEQDPSVEAGHMDNQISSTAFSISKNTIDKLSGVTILSDELTQSTTVTVTNGGIH